MEGAVWAVYIAGSGTQTAKAASNWCWTHGLQFHSRRGIPCHVTLAELCSVSGRGSPCFHHCCGRTWPRLVRMGSQEELPIPCA